MEQRASTPRRQLDRELDERFDEMSRKLSGTGWVDEQAMIIQELESRIEKAIYEWKKPFEDNGTGAIIQRGNEVVHILLGEGT